jgi:endonuclease/exonuclease/phosphatase family metal-dependent hydrolase
MDGKCAPARIATVLRELDCDLFALQEVDNRIGDHAEAMQLDYLAAATGLHAIAGMNIVRHTGEYGNGVLTRFAPLSVRRHDLSYSRFEPRGAIDLTLDTSPQPVRVIAAHLGLRRAEREFQWQRLISVLDDGDPQLPVILLGDMNEWFPPARILKRINALLGEPPTPVAFPSFAPVFALTRVWVRPRGALQNTQVHRTEMARRASDHLPVKVEIDFSSFPESR